MKNIILIVGGARAGKSNFAEKLAKRLGKHLVYLATGEARDKEMAARIKKHKRRRKGVWRTVEAPVDLVKGIANIPAKTDAVLIDCLTLWISNLILAGWRDTAIVKEVKKLLVTLAKKKFAAIIVSNEVGAGIVPADPLGRRYRDLLGSVNQVVAKRADVVYQMCCGIAAKIKKSKWGA